MLHKLDRYACIDYLKSIHCLLLKVHSKSFGWLINVLKCCRYATDVQYVVLTNSRNIVVSWNVKSQDATTTIIHCYHLALDFQTVETIREVESINHYITSLHNIKGKMFCMQLLIIV